MISQAALLSPLYQPLLLQVDFRSRQWEGSKVGAGSWVSAAVVADVVAQLGVGTFDYLRLGGALITFLLLLLPIRLAIAASGLYVTQAVVSLGLAHALQFNGGNQPLWLGYAVTYGWQLWCVIAFALLLLQYVRTPKREFQS